MERTLWYNQKVRIYADHFTENDENCLPTGKILSVAGTPMDFREMQSITGRIAEDDAQLVRGNGDDHNWIINGDGMRKCAEAVSETTGIYMEAWTDQPGLQFYTANYLTSEKRGRMMLTIIPETHSVLKHRDFRMRRLLNTFLLRFCVQMKYMNGIRFIT